jgi:succinate dehydrogenase/fumarate reductase cytochrome b subunit
MLSIYQRITGVILLAIGIYIILIKKQSLIFGTYYFVYKSIYFFVKGSQLIVTVCLVAGVLILLFHFFLGMRYVYWERTGSFNKYPFIIALTQFCNKSCFVYCLGNFLLFQVIWVYIIL